MKERPILFTPENAQKVHADLKTQTRRVINPQPENWTTGPGLGCSALWPAVNKRNLVAHQTCPFGLPGDRLWVREAWAEYKEATAEDDAVSRKAWESFTSGDKNIVDAALCIPEPSGTRRALYKADFNGVAVDWKWRHAMFMPRWASRTLLEITEVRVERVQDISEADSKAEGCRSADLASGRECILNPELGSYRLHFQSLWDSINAKTHPWSENPYVWALTFKRIT